MKNNPSPKLPRVLITMGEPAGIGPEIIVKAAQRDFTAELVVIGDAQLLQTTAAKLSLPLCLESVDFSNDAQQHRAGRLKIEPIDMPLTVTPGILEPGNAQATLGLLSRANQLALEGQADAIVTAPVHKANLNQADSDFMGHTEFFAEHSGGNPVVMMLASGPLRITLATTHIPLSQVPAAITAERLSDTLRTISNAFTSYGLPKPRIGICGLNPHAGEDGLLGSEETQVISPTIAALKAEGFKVDGPFPADTLLRPQQAARFDVFLAMYHDQGLPVVKAVGFGQCANVSLGLPYIRTSVDHGTALDIAPSFCASEDSLVYAIDYAISLASGKLPA